eukprot:SAG31_NODE_436_length_15717_cov_5.420412_5_plen_83_part_00
MHGQVVLEPAGGRGGARGDVSKLRVVQAATFALNATPFAGNYPTGVFTSNASGKEIWYYGTCETAPMYRPLKTLMMIAFDSF